MDVKSRFRYGASLLEIMGSAAFSFFFLALAMYAAHLAIANQAVVVNFRGFDIPLSSWMVSVLAGIGSPLAAAIALWMFVLCRKHFRKRGWIEFTLSSIIVPNDLGIRQEIHHHETVWASLEGFDDAKENWIKPFNQRRPMRIKVCSTRHEVAIYRGRMTKEDFETVLSLLNERLATCNLPAVQLPEPPAKRTDSPAVRERPRRFEVVAWSRDGAVYPKVVGVFSTEQEARLKKESLEKTREHFRIEINETNSVSGWVADSKEEEALRELGAVIFQRRWSTAERAVAKNVILPVSLALMSIAPVILWFAALDDTVKIIWILVSVVSGIALGLVTRHLMHAAFCLHQFGVSQRRVSKLQWLRYTDLLVVVFRVVPQGRFSEVLYVRFIPRPGTGLKVLEYRSGERPGPMLKKLWGKIEQHSQVRLERVYVSRHEL